MVTFDKTRWHEENRVANATSSEGDGRVASCTWAVSAYRFNNLFPYQPVVKVPRVALRAPWARMPGAPIEAMPGHRRGGATPQTGPRRRNPKGARGLRPLDGVTRHRRCPGIDSSSCLASDRRSLACDPTRLLPRAASALIAEIDGRRVAFSGDLLMGRGKLYQLHAMEYSYGTMVGILFTLQSI